MSGLSREDVLRLQNEPPAPPLEAAARFLRMFVLDNDPDEVRRDIWEASHSSANLLRRGLAAIEALLANPPPAEALVALLQDHGGLVLQLPAAEGALYELRKLTMLAREAIGEHPPE